LHSIRDYVGILKTVISEITPAPIVIGHSMGGYVLQCYLQHYDLPAAVLLASAPRSGIFASCWRAVSIVPLAHVRRIMKLQISANTPDVVKFLLMRSAMYTPQGIRTRLSKESMRAGINLLLPIRSKPANTPILVVAAEQDHLFSVEEERATAAFYDADFLLIQSQGHDLMIESKWQLTAALIRNWLERADKELNIHEKSRTT
jgi:pimeloyl-ACP methyl ester carboxylesterase